MENVTIIVEELMPNVTIQVVSGAIKGDQGIQGVAGADGTNGISAYDEAVLGGFIGTEADWLLSLKGTTDIDTLVKLNTIVTDATLVDTNDPRFSDARTPLTHNHIASEVPIVDTGLLITATEVEGALAENRTAINLNTTKVSFPGFSTLLADYGYVEPTHSLVDLTDVVFATNTNKFVLVANGTTGYVGRALLEADISDFGSYSTDIHLNIIALDAVSGTNTGDQIASTVSIADTGLLFVATDVEGALQENRAAINLNTDKVSDINHVASSTTTDLTEGTNLYFTASRVLTTLLTGISFVTGTAVVSTDTILVGFGKLQKQINDIIANAAFTNIDNNFSTNQTINGSIKIADDTDVADVTKAGAIRYRRDLNGSYTDMCMETYDTVYEWVNIVTNIIFNLITIFSDRVIADGGTTEALECLSQIEMDGTLLYLKPSGKKLGKLYSRFADGDFNVVTDQKYVTGSTGVLELVPANTPAFDYSDGSGCPALLVEGASTNLVLSSEDLSGANWLVFNGTIVTLNQTISPDNTLSADRIECGIDGNLTPIYDIVNIINSTYYTFSCFAKKGETDKLIISGQENLNGYARFNLTNGTIISIGGPDYINSTIEELSNGWFRCSVTALATLTTSSRFIIYAGIEVELPALGAGLYIWGVQQEVGLLPTSYIPTTATTVTRAADVETVTTPAGVTSITETIGGVEQTPITVIPATYQIPNGLINKIIMT